MAAIDDQRPVRAAHRAPVESARRLGEHRPDHPWRDTALAFVLTFGLWLVRPFRRRRTP